MKWALIGAGVVLLAAVAVVGAQGELPNLESFARTIQDIQANYRAKHGQYAQILPMSSKGETQSQPELRMEGGAPQGMRMMQQEASTTLTSPLCPSDQNGCPEALFMPENITVTINTYVGPQGEGYELVTEYVDELGQRWRIVENVGPETWRARDWHMIDPEPLISPVEEPTP